MAAVGIEERTGHGAPGEAVDRDPGGGLALGPRPLGPLTKAKVLTKLPNYIVCGPRTSSGMRNLVRETWLGVTTSSLMVFIFLKN